MSADLGAGTRTGERRGRDGDGEGRPGGVQAQQAQGGLHRQRERGGSTHRQRALLCVGLRKSHTRVCSKAGTGRMPSAALQHREREAPH